MQSNTIKLNQFQSIRRRGPDSKRARKDPKNADQPTSRKYNAQSNMPATKPASAKLKLAAERVLMSDKSLESFCRDCGAALAPSFDERSPARCAACFDGFLRSRDAEFLSSYAELGVTSRRV